MIRFIVFCFLLSVTIENYGQLGHGGEPMGISDGKVLKTEKKKQSVVFPPLPASVVSQARLQTEKGRPLRFAHPHFVELTPDNSGHTSVLEDGRLLWQISLNSPGAYSLNVIFDRFRLSPGDSLFIYNPSGSFVIGALTHENNKEWGGLATAPVPGDELIVEWRGQNTGRQGTQLMIGAVNHDYLNVFRHLKTKAGRFGDSGSCHTDLSCYEDETYLENGKSVCKIIVNGTELCSGTLMNNTTNDGTPYILTAAHCMGSEISPESVVFIFNYEVPACQDFVEGSSLQSISGSALRAFVDKLDFALLEMSELPPNTFRPFYAGWSLISSPASGAHTIHHPQGDVKKVAVSDNPPSDTTFSASSLFGNQFETDSHWIIQEWIDGSTEGGSSGAGLFLEEGQFIGLLSGGAATCSKPVNDYYVRLNKIWNNHSEDTARVDIWLDPEGDGKNSMTGYDPTNGYMLRLSHFSKEGTPEIRYLNNSDGFWTGANTMQTSNFVERYNELHSGDVHGVYLMPGKNIVNNDGRIDVQIWGGLDEPQVLLAQKKGVVINEGQDKEVLVMFDQPVSVSGPFFVGYEIDYSAPVDSFGVYQSVLDSGKDNSFFLRHPVQGWQPFSLLSGELPSLLWIDVLVDNAVFADSVSIPEAPKELLLAPNPASHYLDLFYKEDGEGIITVFNMDGKPLLTKYVTVFDYQARIDFDSKLLPGSYLLQLEIHGKKAVKKFVVR